MTSIAFARRKARSGQHKLPPNPKQWPFEHHALDLRDELGIALDISLPHGQAFGLLPNVTVIPHGEIGAADVYLAHFRGEGRSSWSGCAIRMDDGSEYVVYNDAHPETRVRATLTEEFFHLRLEHPRSVIRLLNDHETARTYNTEIEEEAYASGAAALVPYYALRQMVGDGAPTWQIARTFGVSTALVNYRLKVTKLFRRSSGGAKRTGYAPRGR